MILLDQPQAISNQNPRHSQQAEQSPGRSDQPASHINVSPGERAVSVATGSILAALGLSRKSLPGILVAAVGGAMLYRGATGHCSMYDSLGVDTSKGNQGHSPEEISDRGIHVEQAFLINRSPADLYQYWRNFENLPPIMTHLKSVRVIDDRRSHWIAEAPRIVGGQVEWEAEITQDIPNEMIAWRSLPESDIETVGQIRFSKALGDRGTEVHVFMDYLPPAGRVGHWIATLFGDAPRRQMREDLRNFKRLMELGEIPTIQGQSRGTCTGQGKREGE